MVSTMVSRQHARCVQETPEELTERLEILSRTKRQRLAQQTQEERQEQLEVAS